MGHQRAVPGVFDPVGQWQLGLERVSHISVLLLDAGPKNNSKIGTFRLSTDSGPGSGVCC